MYLYFVRLCKLFVNLFVFDRIDGINLYSVQFCLAWTVLGVYDASADSGTKWGST